MRACLSGTLTPELAIARLVLGGADPATIVARIIEARVTGPRWAALHRLASDTPALARLCHLIAAAGVDHADRATPNSIAALFDRAVAISPEASVALYTLGDPARFGAATEEIVAWLLDRGLLSADRDVLDLGCGIGRIAAAIAGHVRSVHGIDVSAGMIGEARRRCLGVANAWFATTPGHDLSALADGSFDLILAVDSFPYLVQAGRAERHVADAHRVLRPDGILVALNFSYSVDAVARQAADWAVRFGFRLEASGATPFRCWDGLPFVFTRG